MSNVEQLYRPGLEGIIAGETNISAVMQDSLMYCGYTIEELAEHSNFEEVAWLLLHGELPTAAQLKSFRAALDGYRKLPQPVLEAIKAMPKDTPGMDMLRTAMSMAGHFCPIKGDDKAALSEKATRILAIVPTMIGARMHYLAGKTPVEPQPGLSHAAQTLWLAFGKEPAALSARILDLTLILYAEHEYNASAFACRVTASTLSDIYSGMVTGIGTLKGPLHGGANEETMHLINQFKSGPEARAWTENAIAKKEKVVGFGHRVYKNGDHRSWILEKELAKLAESHAEKWRMDVYYAIQKVMHEQRKIFMNVDYPCGLTYYYMGLPVDVYTPLFVASRVSGWAAHFIEQYTNNRIIRPLSRYTGAGERKYVPAASR
ncbi:2-methylcitrate synthase 1 [Phycisphaerae bacterium RAS1]|nr:2-methylcitrate synthase 1 [Phycisphaerae bacterium RAS1]